MNDEAHHPADTIVEAKQQLRAEIRQARALRGSRSTDTHAQFTKHLTALVSQHQARRVSCFASTRNEPDTSGFLAWARENSVEVLLPRSLPAGELEWVLQTDEPLRPGAFGIPEPIGEALPPDILASCDLLIIPAAGVDVLGTRIGWGRGYFDRAIDSLRDEHPTQFAPVYAVVFEDEVHSALPLEPHDAPIDGAVTEVRIHNFG
ncbi:5-formyltetrahydrofolate cyclo-ligase [Leucobacter denitrificans]|uniref:5-formyltetrahydrofolate cyclo-ligase n=1 Tax=Leucobacter denitrificans TaxID=683042 RepID=A0A7G9S3X6_9MICO|nr:5-formyltetrahydrofolate cyclo-ligase [Leucobacter denitrificans]QNN62551.1 5-formyltetrahydrofolate cyclo-ligase [Leucobacter denitrificans]